MKIPKPGGGERLGGIPPALDRLVQQAVLPVLQGSWDRTFFEPSYGFRPGRSAHQAVARPEARKFLGFTFTFNGEPKRRIAPQSLERFKLRVRELTRTGRPLAPAPLVHRLKLFLSGWRGYFGFCETPSVLRKLDSWVRRRLRTVFWRQWSRGRSRFAGLRRVGRNLAAKAAGSAHGPWRPSRSPALSFALPNTYFISLGLPTLAPGR